MVGFETFDEEGSPHVPMRRLLSQKRRYLYVSKSCAGDNLRVLKSLVLQLAYAVLVPMSLKPLFPVGDSMVDLILSGATCTGIGDFFALGGRSAWPADRRWHGLRAAAVAGMISALQLRVSVPGMICLLVLAAKIVISIMRQLFSFTRSLPVPVLRNARYCHSIDSLWSHGGAVLMRTDDDMTQYIGAVVTMT